MGGPQHSVAHLAQVVIGDVRVGEAVGHHLALFGDLDAAADRAGRLRQDRLVGRPTAAPDGAAATMKERQRHVMLAADVDQRPLRAVERPVGRQNPPSLLESL